MNNPIKTPPLVEKVNLTMQDSPSLHPRHVTTTNSRVDIPYFLVSDNAVDFLKSSQIIIHKAETRHINNA